jgi:hypothetical protein
MADRKLSIHEHNIVTWNELRFWNHQLLSSEITSHAEAPCEQTIMTETESDLNFLVARNNPTAK